MAKKGDIMDKQEFLAGGYYAKEQYEGLLVSADPRSGNLRIGVELDGGRVMVVDEATDRNIRERIQSWAPQVEEIRRRHR